ncbi:2-hydroxyacyl-CoA dehydratase subunit D [Bacillus sp. Marseille-P3661]|uniref:2-hydroxyacyl-CoA dehydratase subunit D n=1 Tax=Bacillus sp. Marseille-P3661 TaxID=1936234 RepID=UPI000C85A5D8|nr:2-hydroxyacyl-CoA dehydratase family protein [Bacillus sp. Marseille-P3661]
MSEDKKVMTRDTGKASVKRLKTPTVATAYQKKWFQDLREKVEQGEPFAFVNADVPQEIFRAMDIPYVVNQWWSSVCSAKQMSPYYLDLLNEHGYRQDLCRYCSLSLATSFDPNPENGPWGGLPKPTVAVTRLTCDSQAKIFELWSKKLDVPFYPLENTVPRAIPTNWWDKVSHNWDELFEPHRMDYMVEDFKGLIRFLELHTGKTFSEVKFKQVMKLVNEQAEYNRKTRDLIAETIPSPVSITDTVPAVMVPQWQRGTQWAVDMAKSLYEEVKELVDRKKSVCEKENVRLMWLGRGLWFNLGFYQHFEEKYGAAFIWSIYLGLAADGYPRYGEDPLRTLVSRSVGMEDMLHMPPWNSDWYVKEAKHNGIDGVVHLISDSCTQAAGGTYFVKKAFEEAGIPILQLRADPVDSRGWDNSAMTAQLEDFIENKIGVKQC